MDYLKEDLELLADYINAEGITRKHLFVTGGTGFIGSLLTKAFLTANRIYGLENTVTVLVRSMEKAEEVYNGWAQCGLRFLPGDVTHLNVSEKYHYIIHTASPTASRYFLTHPAEVLDINYQGTRQILELAKACDGARTVCLSSMEAFGITQAGGKRLSEKDLGYIDLTSIRSCYSEGKRVMELMCRCYSEEYNIHVCAARLAQTFGAGVLPTDNRVFAQFARSAGKGENIVLHTTGGSMGNYCYTRDAVRAVLTILLKGTSGEVYTVVNESATMMIREMAELVSQTISNGRSKVVFDIPPENSYGFAPETKMKLSAEKLRALGWEPEVGLADMYRRMLPYIAL